MTLSEALPPRSLRFKEKVFANTFFGSVFYSQTLMDKHLKRKFYIKATTNKLSFVTCSFLIVQVCPTSLGYKIQKCLVINFSKLLAGWGSAEVKRKDEPCAIWWQYVELHGRCQIQWPASGISSPKSSANLVLLRRRKAIFFTED